MAFGKCLSILNPYSYLVCAGVKNVESLSWTTDYRGPLYIHSSGSRSYPPYIDFTDDPLPVINDFHSMMDEEGEIIQAGKYLKVDMGGYDQFDEDEEDEEDLNILLRDEYQNTPALVNEYLLLKRMLSHTDDAPFFLKNAVIGVVDLVDIKPHSNSPWAEENQYHWIFKNARFLNQPMTRIAGEEKIWDLDLD